MGFESDRFNVRMIISNYVAWTFIKEPICHDKFTDSVLYSNWKILFRFAMMFYKHHILMHIIRLFASSN